jgi:hypothetical protein
MKRVTGIGGVFFKAEDARSMKRKPVRKKKIHKASERKEAMLAVIGRWKDRADIPDAETYVRYLRNDDRMKRTQAERNAAAMQPYRSELAVAKMKLSPSAM